MSKEKQKSTDERLSKQIEDSSSKVLTEVVTTAKELSTTTASQQVTKFAQKNLKGHVIMFLGDLLKTKDVAP